MTSKTKCECNFCFSERLEDHKDLYMFGRPYKKPSALCKHADQWLHLLKDNDKCCCLKHVCPRNSGDTWDERL